jgi:tetratricopeptide (TPR) repeat protein
VFNRILFFAVLAMPGIAQVISSVRGEVASDEPLTGNRLVVNLTESITRKAVDRAFVAGDGSFEFRNVPPGSYSVELAASSGDAIFNMTVNLNSSGDRIELRLPAGENKAGAPAGTVSVRELQHPLSAKSKRMFAAAQKASEKGEYLKAVEILRSALNDPAAEPYARMNIGVAYIRAGQAGLSVPELLEAVRLMPDDAVARTNLAYALMLTRRVEEAEEEARQALRLDKNNSKARWVMGSILLAQGSHVGEAVEDLRFASREIPKARVLLAQFYERTGQKAEAVRELREFLPQASNEERAKVEQWLSKLVAK